MPTFSVAEVQSRLPELVETLLPGEELVITPNDKPIARLLPTDLPKGKPIYGRGKEMMNLTFEDDT